MKHETPVIAPNPSHTPSAPMSYPPPYTEPIGPPDHPPIMTPVRGSIVTVMTPSMMVPVIVDRQMGNKPSRTICRTCNEQITTRTDRKSTLQTHLSAIILCVLGCWPCICIPYCSDSCMRTNHYCTKCDAYIGSYRYK